MKPTICKHLKFWWRPSWHMSITCKPGLFSALLFLIYAVCEATWGTFTLSSQCFWTDVTAVVKQGEASSLLNQTSHLKREEMGVALQLDSNAWTYIKNANMTAVISNLFFMSSLCNPGGLDTTTGVEKFVHWSRRGWDEDGTSRAPTTFWRVPPEMTADNPADDPMALSWLCWRSDCKAGEHVSVRTDPHKLEKFEKFSVFECIYLKIIIRKECLQKRQLWN